MVATTILSAALQRLHDQAVDLGLVVEIDDRSEGILDSVSIRFTRQQVEPPANMLDVVNNAESVSVHAVRCFGGKFSHSASRWSYGSTSTEVMPVRHVQYALDTMAGR